MKKIKFIADTELCIVNTRGNIVNETRRIFKKDEVINIKLIDYPLTFQGDDLKPNQNFWNIKIGRNGMAYGVSREWFEIIS